MRQSLGTLIGAIGTEMVKDTVSWLVGPGLWRSRATTRRTESWTEALDQWEKTGNVYDEAELYLLKGELTLQSKVQGPKSKVEEEAGECFLRAIDVAQKQQAKSGKLRASQASHGSGKSKASKPKRTSCCPRSTPGLPKGLIPRICKRRRRCLKTWGKWQNGETDKG